MPPLLCEQLPTTLHLRVLTADSLTAYWCYRGEPLGADVVSFKPDVILAADCVYFEPAFPLLLATLSDLLVLCPTATIYFCFKKRRRADMQFLKKAQKAFRTVELVDQDRDVFSRENIFLYSFRSKAQEGKSAS